LNINLEEMIFMESYPLPSASADGLNKSEILALASLNWAEALCFC
jgi:hypothetical protein